MNTPTDLTPREIHRAVGRKLESDSMITKNATAPASAQHNLPLSFVTTGQRVTYLRDVKLNAFATMTREDSPEIAELICRAVNSHAELLAALKFLLEAVAETGEQYRGLEVETWNSVRAARAAIKGLA